MSSAPIPAYPVVYVDVASDGSAHVNVAGRHEHFGPAPSDVTRRAVTAYAAKVAAELHRPVRTQITDPDGQWLVAVHPAGAVTDLTEAPQRTARPRRQSVTVPRGQPPPIAPPPMLERATPLVAELERAHRTPRSVQRLPTATLQFSTGDDAHVAGVALIGRRPAGHAGEDVDLLVTVNDESRMLSRTHLRIEWHEGALWATDRASSNGTTIERHGTTPIALTPWQPFQLLDDDVAVLGDVRFAVSTEDDPKVNL